MVPCKERGGPRNGKEKPLTAASVPLRTMVQSGRDCIEVEFHAEDQLCVPIVDINGESFRLKDKRKAGLLAAAARTAKH